MIPWDLRQPGAVVAQLVEQLIRNEQVTGSNPANGSIFYNLCYNKLSDSHCINEGGFDNDKRNSPV